MKYRRVPGTEIDVSVVCQGTMRFAAKTPGDDAVSKAGEAAVRRALDLGVNFFHSSYQYNTRWLMDRVLADHPARHDLHHIIKVVVPDRGDERRFSADKFRTQVEESLRELHTDRISFVQWLFLDGDAPADEKSFLPVLPGLVEQAHATFEALRKEGKVGHMLAMARTPVLLKAMLGSGSFQGAVERYNLLNMRVADEFERMKENDWCLIPIEPLRAGLLTDRRRERSSLAPDDRFRDAQYDADYARLERIVEAFSDEVAESLTGFALRFHFATPVIPSVAVSMNTPQQVEQIAAALEAPFPPEAALQKAHGL